MYLDRLIRRGVLVKVRSGDSRLSYRLQCNQFYSKAVACLVPYSAFTLDSLL